VRRAFGDRVVLDGIDLSIAPGEFVALLGQSGTGKSTLLRALAGLDEDIEGHITVPRQRAVVFQEPRLMPWLTVRENVRLALLDLARAAQDTAIIDLLQDVGLVDFAEALPRQLSGGMAQRVAIARALARKPSVLLLDEPLSALDSFTRVKLQDHLGTLWKKSRFTLILVTHDIDEAITLCRTGSLSCAVSRGVSTGNCLSTCRVREGEPHLSSRRLRKK
jgi:sulfonate transport system ATP-binding protein